MNNNCTNLNSRYSTTKLPSGVEYDIYRCDLPQIGFCTLEDRQRKKNATELMGVCATCQFYSPPSPLIEFTKQCIAAAERGESVLTPEVLNLQGMSSAKVRHLLSNLQAVNYLEVGTWLGSTLVSAMFGNSGKATAIDNFSQFNEKGGVNAWLNKVTTEFLPNCHLSLKNSSIELVRDLPSNVDVCFYDGDHGYEETRRAIWRLYPCLADEAILIIDDTNTDGVLEATRLALHECGAEVLHEWNLPARYNGDKEQWWNGVTVFLLQKPQVPRISAICLTYDLPRRLPLLNEAVESFLRQTYPNKELIIVNDTPGMVIEYNHPQVTVLNLNERCATLGDKRNAGIDAASGEFICSWDDDDISLPLRMQKSFELIGDAQYFNPKAYWYFDSVKYVHEYQKNYCHQASMFRKSAGRYPGITQGEDATLDRWLNELPTIIGDGDIANTQYIYRWGGIAPHISGHQDMNAAYAANAALGGGTHTLSPNWQVDYLSEVSKPTKIEVIAVIPTKSKFLLSIVAATFDDYQGVWATFQQLHIDRVADGLLQDVEFLVVDNNPKGKHSAATKALMEKLNHSPYIPYDEIQGTSAPRNKAIESASGEYVLCLDAHVLLNRGVLLKLVEYLRKQNPDSFKDLFHGPCLYDWIVDESGKPSYCGTHWKPVWGEDGMFGKWAMQSPYDKQPELLNDAQPFEIELAAMGLFLTSRRHWLGFHAEQRGFGGEEGTIHQKYRQHARRAVCLPWLTWIHRWGRLADDTPRPHVSGEQFLRNYLLYTRDINWPTLAELVVNFVDKNRVSEAQWQKLLTEMGISQGKPGTELSKLLKAIGIPPCQQCIEFMNKMDIWGVASCIQHKAEIVTHIRAKARETSWATTIKAAAKATASGLAFKINPIDPAPGLVAEAIRLAGINQF